jgi:hypothetical protein
VLLVLVDELLSYAEVNQLQLRHLVFISFPDYAHILGFDITVYYATIVYFLYCSYHLDPVDACRLQIEFLFAVQVVEVLSKEI